MEALKAISQQLKEMEERLSTKIDNLTKIVVDGFDKLLQGQMTIVQELQRLDARLADLQMDTAQRDAIKDFLQLVSTSDERIFSVLLNCSDRARTGRGVALDCRNDFVKYFANSEILVGGQARQPGMINPAWSNQMLAVVNAGTVGQIALEQLSLPFFFLPNQMAFPRIVARNTQALMDYGSARVGAAHLSTLANPDILIRLMKAYLRAANVQGLNSLDDSLVTSQAIDRINEVEGDLLGSMGQDRGLNQIVDALKSDIYAYEQTVRALLTGLEEAQYKGKARFLPNTKIPACLHQGGWPNLQSNANVPGSDKTGAQYIPSEIWLAQSMGYVQVGQCYVMSPGQPIKQIAGLSFFPVLITMNYFFNDLGPNPVQFDQTAVVPQKEDSASVSIREIIAPQHISTFWDNTPDIFPAAWTGVGEAMKVFECYNPDGTLGFPCALGKDLPAPPVNTFLNQSRETLSELQISNTVSTVRNRVQHEVDKVIDSIAPRWNANVMRQPSAIPLDQNLAEIASKPAVANSSVPAAEKKYALTYQYVMGRVLQSAWHRNTTTECMELLSGFTPDEVIRMVSDNVFKGWISAVDVIEYRRKDFLKVCRAQKIHPDLAEQRKQLELLKRQQQARQ